MEVKYPPYTITDKMLNYVSDIMKKSLTKLILRKSEKIYQKQKKTGNFQIRVI